MFTSGSVWWVLGRIQGRNRRVFGPGRRTCSTRVTGGSAAARGTARRPSDAVSHRERATGAGSSKRDRRQRESTSRSRLREQGKRDFLIRRYGRVKRRLKARKRLSHIPTRNIANWVNEQSGIPAGKHGEETQTAREGPQTLYTSKTHMARPREMRGEGSKVVHDKHPSLRAGRKLDS